MNDTSKQDTSSLILLTAQCVELGNDGMTDQTEKYAKRKGHSGQLPLKRDTQKMTVEAVSTRQYVITACKPLKLSHFRP
jgi:hypothetical protein